MPAEFPFTDLSGWLSHLERLHPQGIALGLERVEQVRRRLRLTPRFALITVGGTNGKGSTCAFLEIILRHAGYRVGLYTSPHLLRYNERVRIAGSTASDGALIAAFERVEAARGDIPLTYFEFGTLAAVLMFQEGKVEVVVLEVGLGGRLDAVNAFDADCAVITSIGMDHMDYLGDTREQIGFEKAGIFRPGRPAIIAESEIPQGMLDHAEELDARMHRIGRDFGFIAEAGQWKYWGSAGRRHALPWPALRGDYQLSNASAALAALDTLRERLSVDMGAVRRGLLEVELPGRFQVLPGRPMVILDVAHNVPAAQKLAENLDRLDRSGELVAVFAMLRDKDIAGVARALGGRVQRWLVAGLEGTRAASAQMMQQALEQAAVDAPVEIFASPTQAYTHARAAARPDDKILVFGSFLTVADVLRTLPH